MVTVGVPVTGSWPDEIQANIRTRPNMDGPTRNARTKSTSAWMDAESGANAVLVSVPVNTTVPLSC